MLSIEQIKKYRLVLISAAVLLLFAVVWQVGGPEKKAPVAARAPSDKITHAEEVIDPRETWTNRLAQRSAETQKHYEESRQKQQELQEKLQNLQEEIGTLRRSHQDLLLQKNIEASSIKETSDRKKIFEPMAHLSLGLEEEVGENTLKKHVSTYVPA